MVIIVIYGSFLPHPDPAAFKKKGREPTKNDIGVVVGSHIVAHEGQIVLNEGRPTVGLHVTNLCDRPIQVLSLSLFFLSPLPLSLLYQGRSTDRVALPLHRKQCLLAV
jgi:hypothetical protein